MSLLLKNMVLVTGDPPVFSKGHLYTEDTEPCRTVIYPPDIPLPGANTIIDCGGRMVIPSFVCGHHHAYSALARGMPSPGGSTSTFPLILQNIWWKLDRSLTSEMVEASALSTAISCAMNGTTFIIDHHSSPSCISGSLELISKAFDTVGIGHLLCYEITDRNGPLAAGEALAETEAFLTNHPGLVGLHASFTLHDQTLRKAGLIASRFNTGVHIHAAEDTCDQEITLKNTGLTVAGRLDSFGLLNSSKTILSHCLHLSPAERKIISGSPVWIAQNSESNLNNRVGYFNGEGLGDNIMLGTDGMHSNMFRSLRAACFTGKDREEVSPQQAWKRLICSRQYVEQNFPVLMNSGHYVVLDYQPPTMTEAENFAAHMVYGADASDVLHVVSQGKLIVRNRTLLTLDTGGFLSHCRELSAELWRRMQKI